MSARSRTHVVTGSSSGIGRAVAEMLVDGGDRVIGVDLDGADVDADLATSTGRQAMIDAVAELSHGVLDGIVACAGVSHRAAALQVNYFGAVATLGGLRPLLARGQAPRAVVVSSFVAALPAPDHPVITACLAGDEEAALQILPGGADVPYELSAYAISKHAIARWVRREAPKAHWAGEMIALNAVAPGLIRTPLTADVLDDPVRRRLVTDRISSPWPDTVGAPADVASLLAWLVSRANSVVTGQVIFADGGAEALRGGSIHL